MTDGSNCSFRFDLDERKETTILPLLHSTKQIILYLCDENVINDICVSQFNHGLREYSSPIHISLSRICRSINAHSSTVSLRMPPRDAPQFPEMLAMVKALRCDTKACAGVPFSKLALRPKGGMIRRR